MTRPTATINVAPPDYTSLGRRLQERTAQLQSEEVDAQHGYAHGHLCEGMMRGLQQFAEVVDPEDPAVPWQPLFDINLCPDWALPWLAQCVGVRLPQTVTSDQARQMIVGLGLHKRGTVGAIQAAGEAFMRQDTPHVAYFRERDGGDAYRLEIVVDEGSLPETDRPLVNHLTNPRPNGGAGWTVIWNPSNPPGPLATLNAPTFGVWDPPNNPPSLRSIDVIGHADPTTPNANVRVRAEAATTAPFNPLPKTGRFIAGSIYIYPVKGISTVKMGVVQRDAAGAIITSGATGIIDSVEARWHRMDVSRLLAATPTYPSNAASYGLEVQVTPVAGQDFEFSISSAIATERGIFEKAPYGDPVSNLGSWLWNGAADASESHRVPTAIVQNAYASQIPAGLIFAYRTIDGWDYQEMTTQGGTYLTQKGQYLSYKNLSENKKG